MNQKTDMALELADLCDRLYSQVPTRGDEFLAGHFGVEKWSPEFFQIIFSITNRTAQLERLLISEKISEPVLAGAQIHLATIRSAFDRTALSHAWKEQGFARVSTAHSSPIRMLSAVISRDHSYPALSPNERAELAGIVNDLRGWLEEHQLSERDFIRECLIDGLREFLFRFERLEWLGWGYSIESLKDVIMAYFALERGLDPVSNPDAGAMLHKIGKALKKVYGFATRTKEATDTADWALSFFQVAMRAGSTGGGGFIAGYLTGS